ncbi:MAG: diaminopimelate decarboxylase [Oscillospiraceae bacterium]|nr:diaminopimelate decarboxylase [Oscillospiraceae bacterium]
MMDNISEGTASHLLFGGCDTVALAREYGTPLYVMDEQRIRGALRTFRASMEEHYGAASRVAFASKACCFKELYRIAADEGCGADVVSGGELATALAAGMPPERLYFHGNYKSDDELRAALRAGVGRIVVDNAYELACLQRIAQSLNVTADILLRVTPGIEAHTHDYVETGRDDSKFGFTLSTGEAMRGVQAALAQSNIKLHGVHCHIGSQIFDEQPFVGAARVMLTFMNEVRAQTGVTLAELNLGGGFGVAYTPQDKPLPLYAYMADAAASVKACAHALEFPLPCMTVEPGRAVVAEGGITLYTIGHIKEIPGVRTYVYVDGGMADNPRYALYKAAYTATVANRAGAPADTVVTIAGRCCESGDLIQEHTAIPACQPGDILAVFGTGAYNFSMASNYNRLPRPAVAMVDNGHARVAVRRQSDDDLMQWDV